MAFTVSDKVVTKCKEFDVELRSGAQFGSDGRTSIAVEAPACIKPGLFDFDLVGGFTYLGDHQAFQGSFYRNVNVIGRFCSFAGRVNIGAQEHPTDWLSPHIIFYGGCAWSPADDFRDRNRALTDHTINSYGHWVSKIQPVEIGNDVWIGEGAFIRQGVKIGDGAIVGAHAVVTKDVPPYAIVGGRQQRSFDIASRRRLLRNC